MQFWRGDDMLIEIESFYGDKLLHGRKIEFSELKEATQNIIDSANEKDFCALFCAQFGFEEITYSDGQKVDYVIDLDTHLIHRPKY